MGVQFVVRMTTAKGEFWWDGAAIYDRAAQDVSGMAFRAWGWLDQVKLAQRFATRGNAVKAAERLYTELGRLYPVRIDVVVVTAATLGWRVDETLVVEVGDCLGNG